MQQKELIPVGFIFWGLQFVILKTILRHEETIFFIRAFYNSEDAAQRRRSPHHPPGYSKANCPNYPSINSGNFSGAISPKKKILPVSYQAFLRDYLVANQDPFIRPRYIGVVPGTRWYP